MKPGRRRVDGLATVFEMLHYRFVRSVTRVYPIMVLGLYVAAFLLAASMMFIFPPGTLLLFWLGLVGLVFVVLLAKLLRFLERFVASSVLATGRCPVCDGPAPRPMNAAIRWQCESCGFTFQRTDDPAPESGS
jgi:hypothetical protein